MTSEAAPQALRLAEQELAQRDWTRFRFGVGVGILAACIGAATTIINLYTEFEGIGALERVTPGQSILFGLAGGLGGGLLGGPIAYWLYGVRPTYSSRGRSARRLWVWLLLAMSYVIFFAFFTGGVFLPTAQYFFLFFSSVFSVPDVVVRFFNLFTASWLVFGVLNSFKLMFTAGIGAALFGPCAWGVDKLSTSNHPATSKFGPIGLAAAVGVTVLAFATFAPRELLGRLGP